MPNLDEYCAHGKPKVVRCLRCERDRELMAAGFPPPTILKGDEVFGSGEQSADRAASSAAVEPSPLYKGSVAAWTCKARAQGTAGGNDPADCDWPVCGCDPHADKVIAVLEESGHFVARHTAPPTELVDNLLKAAKCVYLACEESVADDLSGRLKSAATELTRLTSELEAAKRERDFWKTSSDDWEKSHKLRTIDAEHYKQEAEDLAHSLDETRAALAKAQEVVVAQARALEPFAKVARHIHVRKGCGYNEQTATQVSVELDREADAEARAALNLAPIINGARRTEEIFSIDGLLIRHWLDALAAPKGDAPQSTGE